MHKISAWPIKSKVVYILNVTTLLASLIRLPSSDTNIQCSDSATLTVLLSSFSTTDESDIVQYAIPLIPIALTCIVVHRLYLVLFRPKSPITSNLAAWLTAIVLDNPPPATAIEPCLASPSLAWAVTWIDPLLLPELG